MRRHLLQRVEGSLRPVERQDLPYEERHHDGHNAQGARVGWLELAGCVRSSERTLSVERYLRKAGAQGEARPRPSPGASACSGSKASRKVLEHEVGQLVVHLPYEGGARFGARPWGGVVVVVRVQVASSTK